MAQAELAMGDLWRAESIARAILQQNPKLRLAKLALASSLRQQARFDSAEQISKLLLPRRQPGFLMPILASRIQPLRPTRGHRRSIGLTRGIKDALELVLALTTIIAMNIRLEGTFPG